MKKREKILSGAEIGAINDELIQKQGEGASQIIQALKGKRYDALGNDIGHHGRSLEKIGNYKINQKYREINIKQQAGFSAELIKEARDNKNNIINGETSRTRTTDGIGQTNNQKYDHIKVDKMGNIVLDSGSQMKVYSSAEDLVKKLGNKEWEKYLDSQIDVPTEQVQEIKEMARAKAKLFREQAHTAKGRGDIEVYNKKINQAESMEKIEKNIRDSGVKRQEAIDARLNPKNFVSKEFISDAHCAGKTAAKGAVLLSGAISFGQNVYLVMNNKKTFENACSDFTRDITIAGGSAYIVAGTGTAIKGLMHSSSEIAIRKLGTTSAPTMIVTSALEIGKILKRYSAGDINETELLEELGEKGTGIIAASYGATLGTLILPGIGSVIGSMIGYTVSNLIYKECLNILKLRDISIERRKVIEEMSAEAIVMLENYRQSLIKENNQVLEERDLIIKSILTSVENRDVNLLTNSINNLGCSLGRKLEFETFDEFDSVMNNKKIDIIL
ncbi:MAG: hypothetical protein RR904_03230 [Bacilli bacterium]